MKKQSVEKKKQDVVSSFGLIGAIVGATVACTVTGDWKVGGAFWIGAPIGAVIGGIVGAVKVAPSKAEIALQLAKEAELKEKLAKMVDREWRSTKDGSIFTARVLREEKGAIVLKSTDGKLRKMQ